MHFVHYAPFRFLINFMGTSFRSPDNGCFDRRMADFKCGNHDRDAVLYSNIYIFLL